MDPVGIAALMTLEQLLDDALVMVMQFLDVKDVLACRLVCKRLCGLALHPDVWRHRTLDDDHPCAGAVLHLAPCLNTLVVTGEVPTLAVTTTRCAVEGLELLSNDRGAKSLALAALVVRNQESLGRLRRLQLATYNNLRLADVLVRTVASCSRLESIDVIGCLPRISHPVVHGPPMPSLTKFRCPLDKNSASFVHAILAGHAATLEEVDFLTCSSPEETTATLLAALPRLRSLRCDDSVRGLQSVASCKMLREVCISLYEDLDQLEGVVKFLRRARQLRRVYLENCAGDDTTEYCKVLVEALASPGQSRVERLALGGFEDVRPLLRVLPSLPALRHLDLDQDHGDELLKSITPVTTPALTLLESEVETCPHAWIHGDAVKSTLAENPSLHIQLWCPPCDPQDCETRVQGCHPEVKWDEVRKIGIYSHDPDNCPSPEDHTDDTYWKRSCDRVSNVACTWIRM